eukprot:TRINITY_DN13543_c0_g1_i1.p1 TRINITY_DN13543_c0_g1~~TRINITY_DN13543_c0_g1_i1.p1  ORF type:complete len:210 (-),score=75.49 TRINITY_DN13543_c0_g1_i1:123-752(-)
MATSAELSSALRTICQKQEQQAVALQQLNDRKEQQLMKMQTRLEEALAVLQAGQQMYAEQQKVMVECDAEIDRLCAKMNSSGKYSAPAAHLVKKETDDESEDEEEGDDDEGDEGEDLSAEGMAALVSRAEGLQKQLLALGALADEGRPQGAGTSASAEVSETPSGGPALLAHLQELVAEKEKLEKQLLTEQAQLEAELEALELMKDDAE